MLVHIQAGTTATVAINIQYTQAGRGYDYGAVALHAGRDYGYGSYTYRQALRLLYATHGSF